MSNNTVERAFELARSGECASLDDIRKRLQAEGCEQVTRHLMGKNIQQSLRVLLSNSAAPA